MAERYEVIQVITLVLLGVNYKLTGGNVLVNAVLIMSIVLVFLSLIQSLRESLTPTNKTLGGNNNDE